MDRTRRCQTITFWAITHLLMSHVSLLLLLTFTTPVIYSFTTLTQAFTYAHEHLEFPEFDNNNVTNPDFTRFYQSQRPSMAKKFAQWLGFLKTGWNPYEFYKLLNATAKKNAPLIGYYAATLTAPAGTEFFIVSDLNGNYHSLIRILQELYTKKIISNNFKLLNSTHYLVFNGNVIGNSAYTLQTFELALRLMEANPHNCLYLTGVAEEKKRWTEGTFKQALDNNFAPRLDVSKLIENLFNSLFSALYVTTPDSETSLRISYLGNENTELKGDTCSRKSNSGAILPCSMLQSTHGNQPVSVMVVAARQQLLAGSNFKSLHFEKEQDTTQWSLASAATDVYRRKFRYFYDAFAVIRLDSSIKKSTLSLYKSDARLTKNFNFQATYNLYTGKTVPVSKVI